MLSFFFIIDFKRLLEIAIVIWTQKQTQQRSGKTVIDGKSVEAMDKFCYLGDTIGANKREAVDTVLA